MASLYKVVHQPWHGAVETPEVGGGGGGVCLWVGGGCNMASLWTDTMDNRHKWLSQMACMILSPRNQR